MPPPPPVPPFLQGVWRRRYIKRFDGTTPSQTDRSPVLYVQTPLAFVDVRSVDDNSLPSTTCMAFAGITTVKDVPPPGAGTWAGGAGAKRVHWHACHNFGQHHEDSESEDCWREGLAGAPRETDDVGDFLPLEGWTGSVWRETDPEGTLEEEWERVSTVLFCRRDLNLEGALRAARAWAAHDARDFEAKLRADEACGRW